MLLIMEYNKSKKFVTEKRHTVFNFHDTPIKKREIYDKHK